MSTALEEESRLARIGIPPILKWGFLAVLIFMTGNAVETNFVTDHMVAVLGSPKDAVATVISVYGLTTLIGSYLAGAFSDLWGPRKVMGLGFGIYLVFEVFFLISLASGSFWLAAITYAIRGFGHPLFAFSFLVWVNIVTPKKRNGSAVGWFYVMFTGGLPTLGALWAVGAIPVFGGGTGGETGAMWSSLGLSIIGFLIVWFGVKEKRGRSRIAPVSDSAGKVILSGLTLTFTQGKIAMGFLVRLINTAPEFGMFVILPAVISKDLEWGQSRWLIMTTCVYATNILVNALFGYIGDKWGWQRTVKWFGVAGSAIGLLLWWYVPHIVPAGSTWGYILSVIAGCVFGCLLAGFVPMGAIMPALAPQHKGAAMAMYTTAAGGANFLGTGVVALCLTIGSAIGLSSFAANTLVVWAFIVLYACAFVMISFLKVDQHESAEEEEEHIRDAAGDPEFRA